MENDILEAIKIGNPKLYDKAVNVETRTEIKMLVFAETLEYIAGQVRDEIADNRINF